MQQKILLLTVICLFVSQCSCIYDKNATFVGVPNVTQYYCNAKSANNSCQPCQTNEDCGASSNSTEWFCWGQKDPQCDGKILGYCNKQSKNNSCNACNREEDCGGVTGNTTFCWEVKDQQCEQQSSFCAATSPSNACKPCSKNTDCGAPHDDEAPWFCWSVKDQNCNATQKIFDFTQEKQYNIPSYCNAKSPINACQLCQQNSDCGGTDNSEYYCWASKDQRCSENFCLKNSTSGSCWYCFDDQDCGGKPGQFYQCKFSYSCYAPVGNYYCNSTSPKNKCGVCKNNQDCGYLDDESWYCWGFKDQNCPKTSISFLQLQE